MFSARSYAAPRTRRCAAKVIVEEESEYHAWLEKQQTFAELSGRARRREGDVQDPTANGSTARGEDQIW